MFDELPLHDAVVSEVRVDPMARRLVIAVRTATERDETSGAFELVFSGVEGFSGGSKHPWGSSNAILEQRCTGRRWAFQLQSGDSLVVEAASLTCVRTGTAAGVQTAPLPTDEG